MVTLSALWCASALSLADLGSTRVTTHSVLPNGRADVQNMAYHNSKLEDVTTVYGVTNFEVLFAGKGSSVRKYYTAPSDWSKYEGLTLTLVNNGASDATVMFRLDTSASLQAVLGSEAMQFVLEPKMKRSFTMWFNPGVSDFGFRQAIAELQSPYQYVPSTNNQCNYQTVRRWGIWSESQNATDLIVVGMSLVHKKTLLAKMVDRYGQYAFQNWSGKVRTDADLLNQVQTEAATLQNEPVIAELAGTTQLPNMGAQGKWRLGQSASGSWYFVHPNGNPFWSLGVNNVSYEAATTLDNRAGLFQELPPQNPEWGSPFTMRRTGDGGWVNGVDFHIANLQKKFGSQWLSSFNALTMRRLPKWGFNSIGAWSMDQFYGSTMPYMRFLSTQGFPKKLNVPFAPWGPLPDPFDAQFVPWMATAFVPGIKPWNNDPNFMGVYVDNEPGWCLRGSPARYNQVPITALNADPSQPAKAAFMSRLQAKYSTIDALNAAWQTSYSSWGTLNASSGYGSPAINAAMSADFSAFITLYAQTYYGGIRNALNQLNLSGLYMGSRNVIDWTPDEVFAASEPYIDGHSINLYVNQDIAFPYIAQLNKPVLISEYGYSAIDRGHSTYGMPTETGSQADRAQDVQRYLLRALATPNVVGAQCMCYSDLSVAGRCFDNLRWNAGLVDVADNPFQEVVAAYQAIGRSIYQLHH